MRLLACLTAALLLTGMVAPPKPRTTVRVVPIAGSVLVISTVQLLGAPDSARISVTGPTPKTRKITASVTDTTIYPLPTVGVTINGLVSVAAYKGGSALPLASAPWTFTGAGATVDVQVKQVSIAQPGGTTAQVCALAVTTLGQKVRVLPWPAACEAWAVSQGATG